MSNTNDTYTPPFAITEEITNLVANIAETIGRISATTSLLPPLKLRKQNRIKTIHSSLAIENNTLSLQQVTAIVEGKRVIGAPNEIREVKNAIDAYNSLMKLNPFDEKDLLRTHHIMMDGLVDDAGRYRTGGVGVMGESGLVHIAPPAHRVPSLMGSLFNWVRSTKTHPLISSCVFHYELEFIHPFLDGNGRMGRLWQTVLLMRWNPIFAWIPVETIIKENQNGYYQAIAHSDNTGQSTGFIAFMLLCLQKALLELEISQQAHQSTPESTLESTLESTPEKICALIRQNPGITINEIANTLNLNRRGIAKHINNLQAEGVLTRVGPNKGGHWHLNRKP